MVALVITAPQRPRRKKGKERRQKREGPHKVKPPRTTSILSLSYVDLKYMHIFPTNLSYYFFFIISSQIYNFIKKISNFNCSLLTPRQL